MTRFALPTTIPCRGYSIYMIVTTVGSIESAEPSAAQYVLFCKLL